MSFPFDGKYVENEKMKGRNETGRPSDPLFFLCSTFLSLKFLSSQCSMKHEACSMKHVACFHKRRLIVGSVVQCPLKSALYSIYCKFHKMVFFLFFRA